MHGQRYVARWCVRWLKPRTWHARACLTGGRLRRSRPLRNGLKGKKHFHFLGSFVHVQSRHSCHLRPHKDTRQGSKPQKGPRRQVPGEILIKTIPFYAPCDKTRKGPFVCTRCVQRVCAVACLVLCLVYWPYTLQL